MEEWNSPIYAFFSPVPDIVYVNGCQAHMFKCLGKGCTQTIRRFLDTGDKKSTSNLHRHVKSCWGEDSFNAINEAKGIVAARDAVKSYVKNGSITNAFTRKRKGKVTYSTRPHTKEEIRCVILNFASTGGLM